jgi:hypothetical protein
MRSALFDDGEMPAFRGPAPPIVSTSADGTFIRTRDGPVEVKIGLWWTGAHRQSPTAAHPRYLLDGKGAYASTQGHDAFRTDVLRTGRLPGGDHPGDRGLLHLRRGGLAR